MVETKEVKRRDMSLLEAIKIKLHVVQDTVAIYDDVADDVTIYFTMFLKQSATWLVESVMLIFVLFKAICMMVFFTVVLGTVLLFQVLIALVDLVIMLGRRQR